MSKTSVSKFFKKIKGTTIKHSPAILLGLGIVGMGSTVVMAVRATPKALKLLEEAENQRKEENDSNEIEPISKIDTVKIAWKPYVPAAITGVMSIACLVGAHSVHTRRHAALATAYGLTEATLSTYKDKVVEVVGEKKAQAIQDEVAKEQITKNPVVSTEVIPTKSGSTLCFDAVSGRYFNSDYNRLKNAENILNRDLMVEMYISLNDLYHEIGLPPISIGDDLGWNVDDGLIDIYLSSQIAEDGTPCLVLSYSVGPKWNYSELI